MSVIKYLLAATITACLAIASYIFYNLYLHPLADYPGPWTWRAFRFTMLKSMAEGRLPHDIARLHKQYGSVVRTAPDELSFIEPAAWKDIYSRRDWMRPPEWLSHPPGDPTDSFIQADGPNHARQRRAFGHAFGDSAIAGYEPYILKHVDTLVHKIREQHVVDMVQWLTFATFDITMDIGWAASFHLLENGSYHPWVTVLLSFKALVIGCCLNYYQPLGRWATALMPKEARDAIAMMLGIARDNVNKRLQMQTDRQDIFANTLGSAEIEEASLSKDEMVANSLAYIQAGSESVATVIVGALSHLQGAPAAAATLAHEIRSTFSSAEQITHATTKKLPYLNAVLKEAMRVSPTIPDGMRRQIPAAGATVCGRALPGGTVVSFHPLAAYMSEVVFERAHEFVPERWLGAPLVPGGACGADFDDMPGVFEPFSFGPRACIGRNLAWLEMYVLLARLVWEFDFKTPADVKNVAWREQKIYWLWEKQPLRLELVARA